MKKKILVLFVIGFLIFSPVVNAVNKQQAMPENLRQQLIALIIEQIKILQAQLNEMIAQQSLIAKQVQQNTQKIAQIVCVSNWQCSNWTNCSDQIQTRTCTDANVCGTLVGKPSERQSCSTVANDIATVELTNPVYPIAQIDAENDINLWQTTWNINNSEVILNSISFRQVGSINSSDIQNFRLYSDGIQIGSVQNLDANGYVRFNLSERLPVGTKTIKLSGDVIGGFGRTFSFSLRSKSDIQLIDTKYNKNIELLSIPPSSTSININSAKFDLSKTTDSPSGDITNDTGKLLAKYSLTAKGENMSYVNFKIENQNSIISNISINPQMSILNLSRNETKIIEVIGDVNGVQNETIQIRLNIEGQGKYSLNSVRAMIDGNTLTIR